MDHFKGRKPVDDVFDLATNQKLGFSSAAGTAVAQTAIEALCPRTGKKMASMRGISCIEGPALVS
jgi:hypothetical protein